MKFKNFEEKLTLKNSENITLNSFNNIRGDTREVPATMSRSAFRLIRI